MRDRLHLLLLKIFGAMPRRMRRILVRLGSPKYTVGAICIVQRDDGAILLVRHSYGSRWGTPGGLAKSRERPEVAAVRETKEEVNLDVDLLGDPVVVVDPGPRRVDVVYLAKISSWGSPEDARPSSPEIERVKWFALDDLPPVQSETATALKTLARATSLELDFADPDRHKLG